MELGFEDKVRRIASSISSFENLSTTGRNGLFAYTHVHDMMKNGRELVSGQLARTYQNLAKREDDLCPA